MSKEKIFIALSKEISPEVLTELISEYDIAKRAHYIGDWEKSILHCGKFSEISLAAIKNLTDKELVDLNNIYFERLFNELTNKKKSTAEEEILLLAIPKAAASVYCLRNKKRVAHIKKINPDFLDSTYSTATCDWILAQLLMLYMSSDPQEVNALICSIMEKQIPLVEQFDDGTLMILRENLSFKEEMLIALYKLNRRVSKKKIAEILMSYPQLVNKNAKKLFEEKLVHINDDGVIATSKGLKYVEKTLLVK